MLRRHYITQVATYHLLAGFVTPIYMEGHQNMQKPLFLRSIK